MTTIHIKRRLGNMEQIQWLMGRHSVFNIVICCEIAGPAFDEKVLQLSLKSLQVKQPYLHARISEKDYPFLRYHRVDSIPLTMKELKSDESIDSIIQDELNKPFTETNAPLCRVMSLKNNLEQRYLIISLHHAISDGVSSMQLAGQLLDNINRINRGIPLSDICYPMRPTLHEMLPVKPALMEAPISLPTIPVKCLPAKELHTRYLTHTFTQEQTSQLLEYLHNHELTMQPFLLSSLACALNAQARAKNKAVVHLPVDCCTLINMRRYLNQPVSNEELGCYISMFNTKLLMVHLDVLQYAKEIAADMKKKFSQGVHWQSLYTFDELIKDKVKNTACHDLLMSRQPYVAVSNCGVTQVKTDFETFKLKQMTPFVTIHNEFTNDHSLLMLCNTFNGELHLNLHYPSPAISRPEAYTIFNLCVNSVLGVCVKREHQQVSARFNHN